jgi:hypothetical protein
VTASISDYLESLSSLPSDSIHLNFLDPYLSPQSRLFVHPRTGLVTSEKKMSHQAVLDFWSNKVFGSQDTLDYSASYPYAISRMHYVIKTIVQEMRGIVDIDAIDLVDFATGEGVFLEIVRQYLPKARIRATEGSSHLANDLRQRGFEVLNTGLGMNNSFRFENAQIGTLMWTLSCTLDPIRMLMDIRQAMPNGSYLVIAESSRVLVPMKKSLEDMFRVDRPADIHPNYFSANTLVSALACAGFHLKYINRFHDSDVLLLITQKGELLENSALLRSDEASTVVEYFRIWDELSRNPYKKYKVFPTPLNM